MLRFAGLIKQAFALLIAALPMHGFAQDYPARTVRMIVPQTPGGATDVFTRAVGQRLAERWARSVIIENRGGAAGTLGTEIAAKAPADGYTLLATYAGSQAINQSLYPKLSFDSIRDFQTVATFAVTHSRSTRLPRRMKRGLSASSCRRWTG